MNQDKNLETEETVEHPEGVPNEESEAIKVEVASSDDGSSETEIPSEDAPSSGEPVTLSSEDFEKLTTEAGKSSENWEKFVRLTAEFDNYKKRAARDRTEAIRYANESLLESLLPTLDNFEMAMLAVENATTDSLESLKQGISMVHKQLRDVIKESGMEEIDAADQPFDPAWHEAVSQQESDDVPEGQVLQQIRKGYKLKDRLIRPANVIVAKAKSSENAS